MGKKCLCVLFDFSKKSLGFIQIECFVSTTIIEMNFVVLDLMVLDTDEVRVSVIHALLFA